MVKADFAGVDWRMFGIGASGFLLLAALTLWAAYTCFIAKESAYGEARFATASDLKRMGLTDRKNASGEAERPAERIAAMLVGQKGQSEDH